MTYEYQLKQYDDLTTRWYSKALLYCEKVRAKFFAILKFPFGGWMNDMKSNSVDLSNDDEDCSRLSDEEKMLEDQICCDENQLKKVTKRKQQLKALQKIYLPNICFVLLDMLSKMNLDKELIKITDLIASNMYKLNELFGNEQLKCFLNKIAESSINLVDSNSDNFGYN